MQHPFEALKTEYTSLLSQMKITRLPAVDATAERLLRFVDAGHYDEGCKATGVPIIVAAASFEREAGSNFNLNPAQGAPLHSRSMIIPHNGPFADWPTAQIAAYKIDGLDTIGAANWSWEMGCYKEEAFNGFGPRAHGMHTGYLWAGSNIYTGGKYVSDGVWDRSAIDQQLGVIPMMLRMVQMRPSLALPLPFPGTSSTEVIAPPAPPPQGHHDAVDLQNALNTLGADPKLLVDGSYGRMTKYAVQAFQSVNGLTIDGVAGPQTWDAISAKLAAKATA
jgi:lysozyme family protein